MVFSLVWFSLLWFGLVWFEDLKMVWFGLGWFGGPQTGFKPNQTVPIANSCNKTCSHTLPLKTLIQGNKASLVIERSSVYE